MSDQKPRIVVVEDDDAIATGLALNLRIAGYSPSIARDGDEALTVIESVSPDLILLDINLPNKTGLDVLGELRKNEDHTPVVILSARSDEFDKVAALRLGADDYVTKPFSLAELLARVDAVLRRSGRNTPTEPQVDDTTSTFANVEVDLATRTVARDGESVKLTHLEFELLKYFLENPSRVFSRDQLLREVWGQRSGSQRTVDNFVGQLRGKLEQDAENPQHFITVRGSGYRFDP
jgi:DNA-binding response OmpR family regulator